MSEKKKILKKLNDYELYDASTNTIYDYSKNIERKASLRNLRRLYIRILEEEAKQRQQKGKNRKREDRKTRLERASKNKIRRQQKRLRRIEKKNQRYSIKIEYIDERKSVRTNIINRNETYIKLVRNEPFTVDDAKMELEDAENDANKIDSVIKHKYDLASVKNIKLEKELEFIDL
jgi:hypothetical protein